MQGTLSHAFGPGQITCVAIVPGAALPIDEVTDASFSSHFDKFPVRRLGHSLPVGWATGAGTIAGSLIFAQLTKGALWQVRRYYGTLRVFADEVLARAGTKTIDGAEEEFFTSAVLLGQLPPIHLMFVHASEDGQMGIARLYNVVFPDQGNVFGASNAYVEDQVQYQATFAETLRLHRSLTLGEMQRLQRRMYSPVRLPSGEVVPPDVVGALVGADGLSGDAPSAFFTDYYRRETLVESLAAISPELARGYGAPGDIQAHLLRETELLEARLARGAATAFSIADTGGIVFEGQRRAQTAYAEVPASLEDPEDEVASPAGTSSSEAVTVVAVETTSPEEPPAPETRTLSLTFVEPVPVRQGAATTFEEPELTLTAVLGGARETFEIKQGERVVYTGEVRAGRIEALRQEAYFDEITTGVPVYDLLPGKSTFAVRTGGGGEALVKEPLVYAERVYTRAAVSPAVVGTYKGSWRHRHAASGGVVYSASVVVFDLNSKYGLEAHSGPVAFDKSPTDGPFPPPYVFRSFLSEATAAPGVDTPLPGGKLANSNRMHLRLVQADGGYAFYTDPVVLYGVVNERMGLGTTSSGAKTGAAVVPGLGYTLTLRARPLQGELLAVTTAIKYDSPRVDLIATFDESEEQTISRAQLRAGHTVHTRAGTYTLRYDFGQTHAYYDFSIEKPPTALRREGAPALGERFEAAGAPETERRLETSAAGVTAAGTKIFGLDADGMQVPGERVAAEGVRLRLERSGDELKARLET